MREERLDKVEQVPPRLLKVGFHGHVTEQGAIGVDPVAIGDAVDLHHKGGAPVDAMIHPVAEVESNEFAAARFEGDEDALAGNVRQWLADWTDLRLIESMRKAPVVDPAGAPA